MSIIDDENVKKTSNGAAVVTDVAQHAVSDSDNNKAQLLGDGSNTEYVVDIFIEAAKDGDLKVVKDVVESGAVDINNDRIDELSGLHWACINNRFSVAKFLLLREQILTRRQAPEGLLLCTGPQGTVISTLLTCFSNMALIRRSKMSRVLTSCILAFTVLTFYLLFMFFILS